MFDSFKNRTLESLDFYSVFQCLEFSRGFVKSCNYKNHKSKVKLKHRNTPARVGIITSAKTYMVEPIYDQSAVSTVKFSRIMLWMLYIFKSGLLFTVDWF